MQKNKIGDKKIAIAPAVVIGVDISALNVIRSLGRRGIEVYAVGSDSRAYGARSRFAKFVFCGDLNEEELIVSTLLKISHRIRKRMVLLGTSDLHVLFISRNRDRLKPFFDFVLPEHEVIETLMNKKNFYEFAQRHKFCIPKTYISSNQKEFEQIVENITYPCVVKPLYRTRYWSDKVPPVKKVIRAQSQYDIKEKLKDLGALKESLIFQEWIPGGDEHVYFCLTYLDRQGKPLALLSGRKIRQYPVLTGVTSLAETIKDPELEALSTEILHTAGCVGLCSVEFKKNPNDGSFIITEPTVGRVDLQEGISTKAGIDIPFLAYQDAIGIPQSVTKEYKTGIKWINEPFEFNYFIASLKRNENNIKKFFYPYYSSRLSFALLAKDDLNPFICFLKWVEKRGLHFFKAKFNQKEKS